MGREGRRGGSKCKWGERGEEEGVNANGERGEKRRE